MYTRAHPHLAPREASQSCPRLYLSLANFLASRSLFLEGIVCKNRIEIEAMLSLQDAAMQLAGRG